MFTPSLRFSEIHVPKGVVFSLGIFEFMYEWWGGTQNGATWFALRVKLIASFSALAELISSFSALALWFVFRFLLSLGPLYF